MRDPCGELADEGELRGVDQLLFRVAEVDGHAIERGGERADLVPRPYRHGGHSPAATERLGGTRQLGERSCHAARRGERDRERAEQDGAKGHREHAGGPRRRRERFRQRLRHDDRPARQVVRQRRVSEEHACAGIGVAYGSPRDVARRRVIAPREADRVAHAPAAVRAQRAADDEVLRVDDEHVRIHARRDEIVARPRGDVGLVLPVAERDQAPERALGGVGIGHRDGESQAAARARCS